jgi:hypothetical protein
MTRQEDGRTRDPERALNGGGSSAGRERFALVAALVALERHADLIKRETMSACDVFDAARLCRDALGLPRGGEPVRLADFDEDGGLIEAPEPSEPFMSSCTYCGTTFAGSGDDCGACPLSDEDAAHYSRGHVNEDERRAMSGGR